MMPSRGLHVARGSLPRLLHPQSRNLSSASRQASRLSHLRISPRGSFLRSQPWQTAAPSAIPAFASIRHASTAPQPSPAQAAATAPPPFAEAAPTADISSITLDDIDLGGVGDITQLPEKIGYLHEIGLNWGYGPTSALEWTLEHIHVYTGMPWWGSIAATAVLLRLITLPFYLKSSDSTQRAAALVSVTKPLMDKMTEAGKTGDKQAQMVAWNNLTQVRKRAGISTMAQFTPIVMQGVIGFCGFKLIRHMANLPVPGFLDGGFLWLKDLTVPDPYGIMPLAMAASVHLLVRMGGESGNAQAVPPQMQNLMLYAMPTIIFFVMAWQPGALAVWFTASGGIGMLQALLLQRPAVRGYLGLAPIYKPTTEEAKYANPFANLMESLNPAAKARAERESLRPSINLGGGGKRGVGAGAGKNAAYMAPQWQAPNIHTNAPTNSGGTGAAGRVIDVKGSSTSASPSTSGESGIMGQIKNFKQKVNDTRANWETQGAEKKEANARKAKKAAAEAYEKRATGGKRR